MKNLMIFLSMTICCELIAQAKYWRGGTGDWSNSTLWSLSQGGGSCFCVPTASDDVYIVVQAGGDDEIVTIPNGYVAEAKRVNIFDETTLILGTTGAGGTAQLLVEDSPSEGVDVGGTLIVRGILAVKDVPDEGIVVRTTGELDVKAGGLIDIRPNDELTGDGVHNLGYVITRRNLANGPGTINIFDVSGNGIFADSTSIIDHHGSLFIEKTNTQNDDGIYNASGAIFTNKSNGKIVISNINNLQSEGIDNRHTFLNEGEITIFDVESAAAISSALSASAIFTNTGMIDISQVGYHGLWIHTDGEIDNSGTITINNIFGNSHHGIMNEARIDNQSGGSISITDVNGTGSRGVYNLKTLNNDGIISVSDVANNNGIRNETFGANLRNFGVIAIRETNFAGLINIDSARIANFSNAKIDLSKIDETAIRNKDNSSFTNWGTIDIDSSSGGESHGIHNQAGATFINEIAARVYINKMSGINSHGIENSGATFTNKSTIKILDVSEGMGLKNSIGFFDNRDSLIIDDVQGGISSAGTGSLLDNSGVIMVRNAFLSSIPAIEHLNFSTITNTGVIDITQAYLYGLVNEATFDNDPGGQLIITNFFQRGILNQNSGMITNDGSITLIAIQSNANIRGVQNVATFINNNYLSITNAPGAGAFGISNNNLFVNGSAAVLEIDMCTEGLKNDKNFENQGEITISNTTGIGLTNLTSTALFINGSAGAITINDGIGGSAILNSGSAQLNNGACASITINKNIRNLISTFENDGFVFQDFSGTNTNTGTFVNDGVVEDRQGSFEGILSSVNNNGVIAGPLHGHHVVGIGSQGVLLGDQTSITPGTFYFAESALTNPVGSYSASDNEWIPSAAGIDVIYLELTNACSSKVIRQVLDQAILAGCEEIPHNIVAASSNGNWHNPFSWNTNQVPTACMQVLIPNSLDITINSGQRGTAQLIDVSLGANFVINGTANILGN